MTLLLIYLFIALSISFICSIAESVLLSTPISYLRVRIESGKKSARAALELKEKIDRPLSAILTLNTIAHTVGAAGVGAQAIIVFGEASFGIISAILTFLILALTEILPKTIGARYYKELIPITSITIKIMVILTYPIVYLSSLFTKFISGGKELNSVSREEISIMLNLSKEEGVLGDKENKIIQNLIKLRGIKVSEIMTPRVVMETADIDMELSEFLKNRQFLHFSRIPVYEGNSEHIIGYIFRQNVFEQLAEKNCPQKLKDLKRNILIIPESKTVLSTWELLLEKKEHIALVVDEYGGVEGIITMEDIIESMLGFEILDEKDQVSDMRQYARERWEMRKSKYNLIDNEIS